MYVNYRCNSLLILKDMQLKQFGHSVIIMYNNEGVSGKKGCHIFTKDAFCCPRPRSAYKLLRLVHNMMLGAVSCRVNFRTSGKTLS